MTENICNINIERGLLSAILFDTLIFEDLSFKLKPHDFYYPFHQHIFTAMAELYHQGKPIDDEFLKNELSKNTKFNEREMLDILSANPITNISAYAEKIKELSRKRALGTLGTEIKKRTLEDTPSDEIIATIASKLDDIDNDSMDVEQDISDIVDAYLSDMAKAQDGKETWVKSGLTRLDNLIDGFNAGDLVVIGARPSMGKTSLATTLTAHFIELGHSVLFDSLEMSTKKILNRLVATQSGESLADLKRCLIKNSNRYNSVLSCIKSSGLFLHGEKNVAFSKLRMKARRLFRKHPKIRFWIIDHIGKMRFKDPRFLRIEIGEITTELKAIAEEFGITVILLSQLNRDVSNRTNKRPTLSDIRESGDIEQDADVVLLLHRDSYYQRGKDEKEPASNDAEIIVAKSRDGITGVAKLTFQGEMARFVDHKAFEIEYQEGYEIPYIGDN